MEVDTKKDIQFYSHLVSTLGPEKADTVAPEIFAQDLSWMSWEACRSSAAKAFFYKIIHVNGEVRLVNQRDLSDQEDILKKINKEIRFGLEYSQMSLVKQRLLAAENGALAVWISPKKLLPEDPDYPFDQINIAKKIDEETVWVKQLQGDFIPPITNLADLMLTIGEEDFGGEWVIEEDEIDLGKGHDYVLAVKQGLSADQLRKKRNELLFSNLILTTPILTSCGAIESTKQNIPSWCERSISGEIRCRFCRKCLQTNRMNNHRCVC